MNPIYRGNIIPKNVQVKGGEKSKGWWSETEKGEKATEIPVVIDASKLKAKTAEEKAAAIPKLEESW